MARVRKPKPSLENLCFATPEQKVLRLLLSEPTTSFSPRTISTRLKGVRGLGGADGIKRVLDELLGLKIVEYLDNQRAVRLADDNPVLHIMKAFGAICDLESLRDQIGPLSQCIVLYGTRADGTGATGADYDLVIVSSEESEVRRIAESHPLGRSLSLTILCEDQWLRLAEENPRLHHALSCGVVLWSQK